MERAAAAAQSHALDKLMVPLSGASEDETLHMSNAKILARAPSIIPGGTVSAGNAAANGDAAAFVIVVSDAVFREFGFEHGLLVGASAAVGCDPGLPGLGSAAAINKLLAKTGGAAAEFSRIELIEAFASQALATVRCVSLDMAKVNPWGGALAFGHPFGASGAILVCHLFAAIMSGDSAATGNRPARFLASGASAGGLGVAVEFAVC
jgi:acetyl-CoA C-acetyltransferase